MRREDGLEAVVDSVEYLGADSLVAATSSLAPRALLARVPGRSTFTAGDPVKLTWSPADEHHFDAQTGGRKP